MRESKQLAYGVRFQNEESVTQYEDIVYDPKSHSSALWELQKPYIRQALLSANRDRIAEDPQSSYRLLDFACGTGRITSFLEQIEELDGEIEGLDLSPEMLAVAKGKCQKSTLRAGDILEDPDLLNPYYDAILSFRFLLNVEDHVRRPVLRQLRKLLREPEGILMVNVHGNDRSLRHLAIARKRRKHLNIEGLPSGLMLNEMSLDYARRLLKESGFEVVDQIGFGLFPEGLYRTPLRGIAHSIDAWISGKPWAKHFLVDVLFVCKPISALCDRKIETGP